MVAFGFISGMLMLKYKPVYAVTIDNTQVGYVVSKDEIEKNIEENILSYNSKNVDTVELKKAPTYELNEYAPNFIGEYYEVSSLYEVAYFTNEI